VSTSTLSPSESDTPITNEKTSLFQRVADRVSYGMGTPANIAIWVILVVGWVLLFSLDHNPKVEHGSFMPAWFTSTGFNFPLNLVTTVAELYIGFLVGASSNRSERHLEATLASISQQDELISAQQAQIQDVEERLGASLEQNTQLTQAVHDLTRAIHASICGDAPNGGAPAAS
jgi:low affinity Fe/Cu permease